MVLDTKDMILLDGEVMGVYRQECVLYMREQGHSNHKSDTIQAYHECYTTVPLWRCAHFPLEQWCTRTTARDLSSVIYQELCW